jgi:glycosyltransferase involved in cell wall biosynthesis
MYHDKSITLTSCFNFKSGYRILLDSILKNISFNMICRSFSPIDSNLLHYFDPTTEYTPNLLDLCILPINNSTDGTNIFFNLDFSRKRILYTMWECTRISDLLVEVLNKFVVIIVPNQYNKTNLQQQGVTVPIYIVQLFCDTDTYIYKEKSTDGKFKFGISNEDYRKNLDKVIFDFLKLFRKNSNVELYVKTSKKLDNGYMYTNINYNTGIFSKEELRDWYSNLDVYISGATCEGWGMMQQESMCCGTPIICTNYGGLREFTSEYDSYYVKYKEVYSTGYWDGYAGKWSEYDSDDMIKCMSHCIDNRDDVLYKGKLASERASQFTESRFIKSIESIIEQYI